MTPMTPSTRLVALVLAISWLPCALAADTGSPDLADLERRLQATFERKIEADVERTLDRALRRKVSAEMDELMTQEQHRLAWLSRHGSTSPASPAPEGVAADSGGTSSSEASGNRRSGAAEAPPPDTLCTFSPPSTFVCVPRPETEPPAAASP